MLRSYLHTIPSGHSIHVIVLSLEWILRTSVRVSAHMALVGYVIHFGHKKIGCTYDQLALELKNIVSNRFGLVG